MEGLIWGSMVMACIVSFLLVVAMVIAGWRQFTKAGQPGWASLIPFYRDYISYKIYCNHSRFDEFLIPALADDVVVGYTEILTSGVDDVVFVDAVLGKLYAVFKGFLRCRDGCNRTSRKRTVENNFVQKPFHFPHVVLDVFGDKIGHFVRKVEGLSGSLTLQNRNPRFKIGFVDLFLQAELKTGAQTLLEL